MSSHCADDVKYGVVETVTARFRAMKDAGEPIAGSKIVDLVTVNGVRITTEDGTWGPRARLVQQAGAGRGRRKPGVGSAHA